VVRHSHTSFPIHPSLHDSFCVVSRTERRHVTRFRRFAYPRRVAFGTGAEHVTFIVFIVYTPSFAFLTSYFVGAPARRMSKHIHARLLLLQRIAPRAGEHRVYFVIYAPSFAPHSHLFAFP
jgi:hypothetical protein